MWRLPPLDRTAATAVVLGFLCIVVGSSGVVCRTQAVVCVAHDKAIGTILASVGFGTLLPLIACLSAYVVDSRRAEETQPLLGYVRKNTLGNKTPTGTGGRRADTSMPTRLHVYLYASHFATAWGDRLWQFAVPLLLTQLFPSTLLPNVIVQLIVYAILIVSMPHLGAFVDATNRWHAVRTGILGMNGMVAVSAAGLVVATVLLRQTDTSSAFNHSVNSTTNAPSYTVPSAASAWPVYAAVAVAVGASAVSQIYNNLQTLALEKDWVVELASATDSPLSAWNTSLLRIDMATRIVSPMVYALQMGVLQRAVPSAHDQVVVLVMTAAGWNLLLAPLQYAALHDVYTLCPSLAAKRPPHQLRCFPPQSHSTIAMWTMYLKHPTSVVSLSFCVLYMTVLKENALSTAYLLWHGTAPATVGWSMGSGAYCGLMASWSYPWLLRRCEYAETVAVASVWLYLGCLAPALYVVWRPSAEAADIVLMVVLAASQFWLWTTSLAETQIMQEWVEPHQRGAVNAMQHTANKGFYMAVLVLGIVYADPHQFHVLILASIGATTVAAIGFTVWYYQHR